MVKITVNPDEELAEEIRTRIKENNGHCACAVTFTPDNKCICQDFRDQIEKGEAGECHCGLYIVTIQN